MLIRPLRHKAVSVCHGFVHMEAYHLIATCCGLLALLLYSNTLDADFAYDDRYFDELFVGFIFVFGSFVVVCLVNLLIE